MPWLLIAVLAVILLLGIIAYTGLRHEREMFRKTGKHPAGHYRQRGMAIGIAFGAGFGMPLGIAFENIALGIPLGLPIGLAFGLAIGNRWEKEHEKELRPLTGEERKRQQRAAWAGVALGALMLLIMLAAAVLR